MMSIFEELIDKKYINLQTFKKNGSPVNTPVWFVILDNHIYVITREKTGKVKRLQNDKRIKIAICSFSGKLKGGWIPGHAEFTSEGDTLRAVKLRNQKYGFWAKMVGIFTKKKGQFVGLLIKLD